MTDRERLMILIEARRLGFPTRSDAENVYVTITSDKAKVNGETAALTFEMKFPSLERARFVFDNLDKIELETQKDLPSLREHIDGCPS
jgi:hypothetical protein